MMKLIKDTLKVNDRFSQKRIMSAVSFVVATIYGFVPVFLPKFEVKEFVFLGFLGLGGFTIYRTQKPNQNKTEEITE